MDSVGELWRDLSAAVETGVAATIRGDVETARECARAVLSFGSKLHGRLSILVDIRADGQYAAEVDRALKRVTVRQGEIEGQQALPTPPADPPPPPARRGSPIREGRTPRKGKPG